MNETWLLRFYTDDVYSTLESSLKIIFETSLIYSNLRHLRTSFIEIAQKTKK